MGKFFGELMESVQQMDKILHGERRPSREFHVDAWKTIPTLSAGTIILPRSIKNTGLSTRSFELHLGSAQRGRCHERTDFSAKTGLLRQGAPFKLLGELAS
ncbi:hypothetical protein ACYZT7_02175 [Pseudomonas sp. RT4P38]